MDENVAETRGVAYKVSKTHEQMDSIGVGEAEVVDSGRMTRAACTIMSVVARRPSPPGQIRAGGVLEPCSADGSIYLHATRMVDFCVSCVRRFACMCVCCCTGVGLCMCMLLHR